MSGEPVLKAALQYAGLGLAVIPLKPKDKRPDLRRWKQYQKRQATREEIRGWFSEGDRNVGVVCGGVSDGLLVLDFEDARAYAYCFPPSGDPSLTPLVQTGGGGIHVYLRGELPDLPKTLKPGLPLDLQGEGRYVVAPPSIHPSGKAYAFVEPVVNEPKGVKDLNGLLVLLQERAEEWPLVEPVLDAWTEGVRHEFALGYAAFLRKKAGFSEERARDVVRRICAATEDRETEDRIRAVEDTYRREPEEVAALDPLGEDLYGELMKRLPEEERREEAPRGSSGFSGLEAFARLQERFAHHFDIKDPYILEVELATLLTVKMPGDPLWIFIVGPPSGMKTESLRWLRFLEGRVYSTSSLTPHSLISGLKGGHDLLPFLDGKTLTVKDFTAILEMRRESREQIFSQLRDAFDGYTEKDFGSVGHKAFESRFHILAGVTGAIEGYYSVQSWLGQRFLKARVPETDAFQKALDGSGNETGIRWEMAALVQDTVAPVDLGSWRDVDTAGVETLRPVVELLARARAHVPRDESGNISALPEPELTPRLAKQLRKLCIGRAMLYGREKVEKEDLVFARRVALDTIPSLRRKVLGLFVEGPWTVGGLREDLQLPRTTAYRLRDELLILGLIHEILRGKDGALYALEERWNDALTPDTSGKIDSQKRSGGRHGNLPARIEEVLRREKDYVSSSFIAAQAGGDQPKVEKWLAKFHYEEGKVLERDGLWRWAR